MCSSDLQLRRIGGWEIIQDAILVSQDAGNIQVLDPADMRAVDIPRPPGWMPTGETVPVLRWEERLYLPALDPPRKPTPKGKAKKA